MTSNALKALLGVLAVAGYQNRDKIGEILRNLGGGAQSGNDGQSQTGGGLGDLLGGIAGGAPGGLGGLKGLGDLFGTANGGLSGGLGDLLRQFEQKGQGETVKSWVQPGENRPIGGRELSDVIGAEVLDDLSSRTGLSPEEILTRLSRDLPTAVDDLTPGGRIPVDGQPGPTEQESSPFKPTSI